MFLNNKYIYGFLTTVVLGLTACSDSAYFDNGVIGSGSGADNEVSFLVSLPTGQSTQTRGNNLLPNTISDGTKIDKLIFSIYEVPYTNGEEDVDNAKIVPLTSGENGDQKSVPVNPESWPISIKLSLDPSKDYRVVFWAQNSECDAYDTKDLTKIKVNYKEHTVDGKTVRYENNDERRDAFCEVAEIKPSNAERSKSVTLRRPFAQINIGTTGADYANLIYNPNIKPNYLTITQSKITIEGVANIYNALKKEAYAESENDKSIEYDWKDLPAWINSETPAFDDLNDYLSYKEHPDYDKGEKGWEDNPFVKIPKEEFLYVKLNNKLNGDNSLPKGYITSYPTVDVERETKKDEEGNVLQDEFGNPIYTYTIKEYKTETFKYLSMCYVLVPTPTSDDEMIQVKDSEDNETEVPGSTVTIKYSLRQFDKNGKDDETTPITLKEQTIYNVPVSANYRTNLLGGLCDSNDDPTSIFNTIPIIAKVVTCFEREYFVGNAEDESDNVGQGNGDNGDQGSGNNEDQGSVGDGEDE